MKKGSVVVDVGGGYGGATMVLAKALPDLRFVVQDLPAVINGGIKARILKLSHASTPPANGVVQHFENQLPSALASGLVTFQCTHPQSDHHSELTSRMDPAHDFFTPQPVLDASVFILRSITHDWADAYTRKILQRLRDAARTDTKLLVCDLVIPHAVRVANRFPNIAGAEEPPTPEPLIPHLGAVGYWLQFASVQVRRLQAHGLA